MFDSVTVALMYHQFSKGTLNPKFYLAKLIQLCSNSYFVNLTDLIDVVMHHSMFIDFNED